MRRIVALVALLMLVQPSASAAPGTTSPAPAGLLADRDHDGLSDDLQARLASADPAERVRVVVTFDGPGDAASARAAVGDFQVRRTFRIIRGFAATMTASQARALSRRPEVFRLDEDFTVSATLEAARTDFGADAARAAYGATGSGVGICIADTGIAPGHEQLDDPGKIAGWRDLVNGRPDPYDDHGHGTHVAAIAAGAGTGGSSAGRYAGVARGAAIYGAKVLDGGGSGSDSQVIGGVEWCAAQPGVRVISMSLGTSTASDGQDSLSAAVNNAAAAGVVVVVAAGNSGDDRTTVGAPGAAAGAITVGAAAAHSGPAQGLYLAYFSSRGPTVDGRVKPDIAAPGVSVTSAKSGGQAGYVAYSGTSMATPFVAGTVALGLEERPSWSPGEVRAALEGTAQDRGPLGKDGEWGAGLVDVLGFVAAANATSAGTTFPAYSRVTGSVANNGVWSHSFQVVDLAAPIAAMLTIEGEAVCVFWCLGIEWSPDLDLRLKGPSGGVIAESTCAAGAECGVGRQETIHVEPPAVGTYTIEVYPFANNPNNGKGGSFALELSGGIAGSPPPPPPDGTVHVGDLDGTSSSGQKRWTARVTITVHDAGENAVPGAVVTGAWGGGASVPCTTGTNGSCSLSSTYANKRGSIRFSVSQVSSSGRTYTASANHDPDGDSNGTTLTILRP